MRKCQLHTLPSSLLFHLQQYLLCQLFRQESLFFKKKIYLARTYCDCVLIIHAKCAHWDLELNVPRSLML